MYCSKMVPNAGLYSATRRGHFSSMKRIDRMSREALRTGIPSSSPIFSPKSCDSPPAPRSTKRTLSGRCPGGVSISWKMIQSIRKDERCAVVTKYVSHGGSSLTHGISIASRNVGCRLPHGRDGFSLSYSGSASGSASTPASAGLLLTSPPSRARCFRVARGASPASGAAASRSSSRAESAPRACSSPVVRTSSCSAFSLFSSCGTVGRDAAFAASPLALAITDFSFAAYEAFRPLISSASSLRSLPPSSLRSRWSSLCSAPCGLRCVSSAAASSVSAWASSRCSALACGWLST
mmetsp:Transcript_5276/g.15573  ORF Transcript_5276/g.15573 Transcript_5276/m.15573 type:complete len:294 (+) Transcript_5276:1111-1992(+)